MEIGLEPGNGKSLLTATRANIKFNKPTEAELNYPPYVKLFLNAQTNQVATQPCTGKDPAAVKFSNEEAQQTYAIVVKVSALLLAFSRLLDVHENMSYTMKGTRKRA